MPNPLSENTICFLFLTAIALVIVKRSLGITEGQNPRGARHLQTPLTSEKCAGAGRISCPCGETLRSARGGTGNRVWRLFPKCLQPALVWQSFLRPRQVQWYLCKESKISKVFHGFFCPHSFPALRITPRSMRKCGVVLTEFTDVAKPGWSRVPACFRASTQAHQQQSSEGVSVQPFPAVFSSHRGAGSFIRTTWVGQKAGLGLAGL